MLSSERTELFHAHWFLQLSKHLLPDSLLAQALSFGSQTHHLTQLVHSLIFARGGFDIIAAEFRRKNGHAILLPEADDVAGQRINVFFREFVLGLILVLTTARKQVHYYF